MAHKVREIMQYSEYVYYDDNGEEKARERVYDDHLYDTEAQEDATEQEIEDYGLGA